MADQYQLMLDSVKSQNVLKKIAIIFSEARKSYEGPFGYQRERGRKGISLRDLAEHTGLKHTQVSDIEHARRNAGILSFFVVAEFLNIDLNKVLKIIREEGKLVVKEM